MNKTLFVSQLSEEVQNLIKEDIKKALNELELDKEEYNEALENAMDSRLSDLEDTIDITSYL